MVTLLLYLLGTGAAAFTTGHHTGWLGVLLRHAAINSAIDEMMPSKYRGRVDIWINGSYWAGAILGSRGRRLSPVPSKAGLLHALDRLAAG